jgi:hypothetical protein
MSGLPGWLPQLVLLDDYDGDWGTYIEAVYEYFRKDFIESSPVFEAKIVGLKRLPYFKGKEYAFWHVTSEGPWDEERVPNLRRCERIRWPRPLIEHPHEDQIKCWPNKHGGERRIVIWLCDHDYVVILADRKRYMLLWTAYYVDRQHTREKLLREYEDYQKRLTPPF